MRFFKATMYAGFDFLPLEAQMSLNCGANGARQEKNAYIRGLA
jgi:hypothetical protein